MRQAICFVTQFADDRHIKTRSARASLIFCPICRDCHVKNQSARAFLDFGVSFDRHTPRLFAIYTGIAVPSRNFIRLLGHLLTSNRKISLFFSSVSSFFLSERWLCFVKSQCEEKERRCRSLHIDSYAHDLYLHSAKPRNMDRLQRTSIHTPSLHSSVGFTLFILILHPFIYMVCSHYDRL